jgi:DNA-directed RNA polymerase specialized sigma24 family protein
MSDALPQEKKWHLTQQAFDKFLASLDADRERAAEQYEKIRGKLITYFECRDRPFPEDHADETINRVARKIEAGEAIRDPATYVYGVARMLLLEIAKEQGKEQAALDYLSRPQPASDDHDLELRVECFKRCLDRLPPESRELITQYYEGERRAKIENRNHLAARLAIPVSALRIRAYRIRATLEACVARCVKQGEKKGEMKMSFPPVVDG